ncbi:MAG: phosphomannomutase/phosphoglucomutase, partial [Planctomycetota bacterium]|nr:phosphomannomutase/phosphoglucomutase [Planctomycetota bacterium]
ASDRKRLMLAKVFKAYDIRATYPKPLDEGIAWQVGYATAQYLLKDAADAGAIDPMSRTICVGRDMRKSSPSLAKELKQGMRDAGASVIDLGLVDTPFVYFAINHLGCAGGVQVTASHNPANYNGFKISKRHAKPVGQDTGLAEIQRLAAMVEREKAKLPAGQRGGHEESRDLWSAYREHLRSFIDPRVLSGERTLKIAIDASNGMAGTMVPKVFDGIKGLAIEPLYFDNSKGEFVHEPNPLVAANLRDLQAVMAKGGFDAGFCFDGDADRCIVLDEKGAPIGCDLLLGWLVADALRRAPGSAVVFDLRSSRSVAEIIRENGGVPVESKVGHVFMKARLAESRGSIGGELSGHFYFADMWNTDSGARAFAAVVSALAGAKAPLSKLIAPCKRYVQSGEINFENEDKLGALARLKAAYPRARTHELDGLSIDAGDWWANIRMSNTEPLLRLNLEARDEATVATKVAEVSEFLGHRVEH